MGMVYLNGQYLMGKDWSRGFIHNNHTYENPLELWKYLWRDTDGVAQRAALTALEQQGSPLRIVPFDSPDVNALIETHSASSWIADTAPAPGSSCCSMPARSASP